MEIEEIKIKKLELENEIYRLVQNFNKTTQTTIVDIGLVENAGFIGKPKLIGIDLAVKV